MSEGKVSALVIAGLALAMGCSAGVKATAGSAGTSGTDAGADHPITGTAGTGSGGTTGAAGVIGSGTAGTTGTGGAAGACVPSYTCTPVGGTYCNTIGNGCKGQKLDCGTC